MARVSPDEVLEIVGESKKFGQNIVPFITAANLIVTRSVATSTTPSAEELKEVERWLAAHLLAIADEDLRISSEGAEGLSVSYAQQIGKNLDGTVYGQQAMLMDPTGLLKLQMEGKLGDGVKPVIKLISPQPD